MSNSLNVDCNVEAVNGESIYVKRILVYFQRKILRCQNIYIVLFYEKDERISSI